MMSKIIIGICILFSCLSACSNQGDRTVTTMDNTVEPPASNPNSGQNATDTSTHNVQDSSTTVAYDTSRQNNR